MAARLQRKSTPRWSGAVVLIACIAILALGGYIVMRGGLVNAANTLFSSGGDVDLAAAPQPRVTGSAAPAAPDASLAVMQPSVATDADTAAPESWPALPPAALLEQAAAAPNLGLKDTGFDRPPWQRYARPFDPADGGTKLAILVTGLGTDRAVTAAAVAGLPAEVSLSFSPQAPDLADWIAAARAFGHEALLDLPMESKTARDAGPGGLMIALNDAEIARRIDADAAAGMRIVGFASAGGDALLLDDRATRTALAEIARLGLGFVDASGEPTSEATSAASDANLAFARMAVALDETASRAAVAERLAVTAETAIQHGTALAVARASPNAIVGIADWARRQTDQAPVLAPASALLQQ